MNMTVVITRCTGVVFTWMTPLGDDDDEEEELGTQAHFYTI